MLIAHNTSCASCAPKCHFACGVCYNDPEDLLKPLTIQSLIIERFERTFTFQEAMKGY